jgi:hypothetical protein
MQAYEEIEYSNVALQFEQSQIQRLIEELVEAGLPISWKDTNKFLTISVQTSWSTQRLTFTKYREFYRLRSRNYLIKDQRLANILQRYIYEVKGHAVMKLLSSDQLVVQDIRYGEPVRIVQIKGAYKKILFEKECIVTMEQVTEAFNREDAEKRIPVLKLEIDYELAILFEAMNRNDKQQLSRSKQTLEKLRQEMIMLEV